MSTTNDAVSSTARPKEKIVTANGVASDAVPTSISNTTNGPGEEPKNMNIATTGEAIPNADQSENLLYTMPTATTPQGIAMFPTFDASWGATYDPTSFMMSFPGMITAQNPQFYFPAAASGEMNIWSGQDLLVNQPFLMNPMAMDQQHLSGSEVSMEGTVPVAPANAIDPITGLAQNFTGMALNGGIIQPIIPTVAGTPGGVDASPSSSVVTGGIPTQGQNSAPQPEKPKSWAAIASQPARPRPPPPPKPQPAPEITTSDNGSGSKKSQSGGAGRGSSSQGGGGGGGKMQGVGGSSQGGSAGKGRARRTQEGGQSQPSSGVGGGSGGLTRSGNNKNGNQSEVVGRLKAENKYNPSEMTLSMTNARFFVIKSYAEDDIHRSIKYSIWTSTEHGNRRLDQAFREQKGKGHIYLLFSVNGSGHFCGVAEMTSEVDFGALTGVWAQDKWKGRFDVKWIYVKDVPNNQLRHIRLENNENKPVTNSRDTQEVPLAKAKQVMKVFHSYQHTTSIFDDFDHYEKKQEEEKKQKS